jgi:hypothetical protein
MRRPGRKSAASLSVVPVDVAQQRPKPPRALTPEGKKLWCEITSKLRPDWFQGCECLLEIFCRSVVLERWLCQQIQATDPKDDKRLAALVSMQKSEAMVIGNLAGKLRLTPRSSFDRYTPKLVSTLPQPWQLGRDPARPARPIDPSRPFDLPPRDPSAA